MKPLPYSIHDLPFENITHLTLNTGHTSLITAGDMPLASLPTLIPLVRAGEGPVPFFPAYRVVIAGEAPAYAFTIYRGGEPLITCTLCLTEEASESNWAMAEKMCSLIGFNPAAKGVDRPTSPWLGVLLLPSLANQTANDICWMGDFERCLACTLYALYLSYVTTDES